MSVYGRHLRMESWFTVRTNSKAAAKGFQEPYGKGKAEHQTLAAEMTNVISFAVGEPGFPVWSFVFEHWKRHILSFHRDMILEARSSVMR